MKPHLAAAYALAVSLGFVVSCGSDDSTFPAGATSSSTGGSAGAGSGPGGQAGMGGAVGGGMPADGSPDGEAGGTGGATGGAAGEASVDGAQETDVSTDGGAPDRSDVETTPERDAGAPDISVDVVDDTTVDAPDASTESGRDEGTDGATDAEASRDAAPEVEAEAEAWTPARLANLSLWLDAEIGVTSVADQVIVWNDRSGNANHASQLLPARRPTLVNGAINGHPALHFDGQLTSLGIPDAPTLRWGTADYTLEVVASFSNDPNMNDGFGMIYGKFEGPYPYIGPKLWANYAGSPSILAADNRADEVIASSMVGLNDGHVRLYAMRRTTLTHFEVRVNGTATNRTISITNVDALSSFVFIGGHQTDNGVIQAMQGDIAEIVAVGGSLPPADLATLETYLKTKYGL